MLLRRLELVDVRSYVSARLELTRGATVLVGGNGQGKTNVLEAVQRVAVGSSHRVAGDGPLVRAGAQLGVVRVVAETDEGRRRTVEVELATGRRTRTRVDGHDVRRAADALGVIRAVLFAPEDLALVRGDPADRRRFLDDLLAQRRPAFATARGDYERVVRQRNNLLKQVRSMTTAARQAAQATIQSWTEQLLTHATSITAARIAAVHALAGPVERFYRDVAMVDADAPTPLAQLSYTSAAGLRVDGTADAPVPDRQPIEAALREALTRTADEEVQRGVTLVGPHRDDLELTLGGMPARTHASQGEAWSFALALKLSTHEVLSEVGDRPVVLLDDVFAELDTTRRSRLAAASHDWEQVLVTAAVEADVPIDGSYVDVRMVDGASGLAPRSAQAEEQGVADA